MGSSDRVLFVDDDPPVRTAFRRSLRGRGFEIDLAADGEEALTLADHTDYAVIATDYRMPGLHGLELVHRLREHQPDATFVLVSGECDLDLALEAVNERGLSHVLQKPWDTEELASVLRRSIEAYWERSSQRRVQAQAVRSSQELVTQKERLETALADAEELVTQALLNALTARGHETGAHCRRVSAYAVTIAKEMGLRGRVLTSISRGALLHDVGKIGIPDAVLLKQGPLTPEEWDLVHAHPETGAQLLSGFESLSGARLIVSQHHERWDGSGYPAGLSGDQIAIGARIFALADTLDAMTTGRAYRQGLPIEQAIRELELCSGSQFDPACVEAFLRVPSQAWVQIRAEHPDPAPAPATKKKDAARSAA